MSKRVSFLGEFKKFALKGNVMDLAVGVIIGGAFSGITASLVNDILMPIVGLFISEHSFSAFVLHIGSATLNVGLFLQTVLNFIILAFVVFLLVKAVNNLHKKEAAPPPPPPAPKEEVALLTEIRDLLASK
ncbi:Large-conductance mechanosensitive channel [bioreactor metagenome]|uniref:Large-conductance mechanosensitive channel n=1 Tax=bioreactor metagenome TaxID=1076179 RepID=A0A645DEW3_9ZZZZ